MEFEIETNKKWRLASLLMTLALVGRRNRVRAHRGVIHQMCFCEGARRTA